MAGRRPKTSAERMLAGGGGHRPLPNDPKPTLGWPDSPPKLSALERCEWKRLGGLLESEKRLSVSDGPLLEAAVRAYSMHVTLLTMIRVQKIPPRFEKVTVDGAGVEHVEWKREPTYEMAKGWLETYRHCLNDLTLSPGTRARARMPHAEPEKPNALQQLQQRAAQIRRVK
jgi:P27 family predicted phage terminase small subunit